MCLGSLRRGRLGDFLINLMVIELLPSLLDLKFINVCVLFLELLKFLLKLLHFLLELRTDTIDFVRLQLDVVVERVL